VPEVAGTVARRAAKYTLSGFGAGNLQPKTVDYSGINPVLSARAKVRPAERQRREYW